MSVNFAVPHKGLEEHLKQGTRQANQSRSRLTVSVRHVTTPDTGARVSRAFDILLEAAAKKHAPKGKIRPKTQQRRQSG